MKIKETPEVRTAIARRALSIRYRHDAETREWDIRLARARAAMLRREADLQTALAESLESTP